ncbi:HNH endonuclease signature motif containing protein [Mailhella sp.]
MKALTLFLVSLLLCIACAVQKPAKPTRSMAQRQAFLRQHGLNRVPPGFQVDHIVPLCAGGPDHPDNMQLLSIEDHKEKTRDDIKRCRAQ